MKKTSNGIEKAPLDTAALSCSTDSHVNNSHVYPVGGHNHHLSGHHPSPLGHSETHSHYIKPVPPNYVTEYESAYNNPLYAGVSRLSVSPPPMASGRESSSGSPLNHPSHSSGFGSGSGSGGHMFGNSRLSIPPIKQRQQQQAEANRWETACALLKELSDLGYERSLISGVLPKVQSRSLDTGIEYCYDHLKTRLNSKDVAAHVGDEERRAMEICQNFVDCVDKIKDGAAKGGVVREATGLVDNHGGSNGNGNTNSESRPGRKHQ